MIEQIGDGVLNELHSISIYHNDLKPNNIMYDPQRKLFYLVDFGKAVPLSLMNQNEFERTNIFASLQFMSPWHLKLVHQSRYFSDNMFIFEYKILNNNETQLYAANADFYAFGLTAIQVLGKNCEAREPLCYMAQSIVSFQEFYFNNADSENFIRWNISRLQNVLLPYWETIQNVSTEYMKVIPYDHKDKIFISSVFNWLRPFNY